MGESYALLARASRCDMTLPPHRPAPLTDAEAREDHTALASVLGMVRTIIASQASSRDAVDQRMLRQDQRIDEIAATMRGLHGKVDRINEGVGAMAEQMRSMDATLAARMTVEEARPRAWVFLDYGGVRALILAVIIAAVSAAVTFGAPARVIAWLAGGIE